MNYIETNNTLRKIINELIEAGYKKTVIGKLLFGQSGYIPILNFLDNEHKSFGVKPLSRLADVLDYELHVVFVNKDDVEIKEELEMLNINFIDDLRVNIINILDQMKTEEGQQKFHIKKRKPSIVESIIEESLINNKDNTKYATELE